MRIAVLNKDKCQPDKCSPFEKKPCIIYCPRVRTGDKTIVLNEIINKVEIVENLCSGCGICVKKCPFNAINIINLPDQLKDDMTYRYGPDQFCLFRMAIPKKKKILGIIGQNGIGKSTLLKILSGSLKINFGKFKGKLPEWNDIISYFRGSELQQYFSDLNENKIKIVHKPQDITTVPKYVKGKVYNLLKKNDMNDQLDTITEKLNISEILDRDISVLSGGELQRVTIAAGYLKDGDIYLIDEPSSYLDVSERINMAKLLRSLAKNDKTIIVVEHDLAILDYLSDYISLLYGIPGAYGIISHPQGVRVGINIYLNGYIKMKIFDLEILQLYFMNVLLKNLYTIMAMLFFHIMI